MAKTLGSSCLNPSMGMGECTTRASSGAASEKATCESLNTWGNNFSLSLRKPDARRAGSKANCPHPLKPRPPHQGEQRVWGGVVKHLPSRYLAEPLNPNDIAHVLARAQKQLSGTHSLSYISASSSDTNNHMQMHQQLSN